MDIVPVLFDEWFDDRKFVREELLVFRAVKFLMSPLLERDVSTEKENKPAEELSCVCIHFTILPPLAYSMQSSAQNNEPLSVSFALFVISTSLIDPSSRLSIRIYTVSLLNSNQPLNAKLVYSLYFSIHK